MVVVDEPLDARPSYPLTRNYPLTGTVPTMSGRTPGGATTLVAHHHSYSAAPARTLPDGHPRQPRHTDALLRRWPPWRITSNSRAHASPDTMGHRSRHARLASAPPHWDNPSARDGARILTHRTVPGLVHRRHSDLARYTNSN
jgi:hypothetical protein